LGFVSSADYLTSGIAHRYLLPYNGSHVVKPDCLAEFNDFGPNRAKTLVPGNGNKVFYIFLAVTFSTKFCQQWTEATGSHLQIS